MSFDENQAATTTWGAMAANATVNERADFIKKTYLHLLGAVLLFCGLEYYFISSGLAERMMNTLIGHGHSAWLIVMILFMGVAWLANYWAISATSRGLQYAGLGLYVLAQSLIFAPLLFIADKFGDGSVIPTAGLITLVLFAGLTVAVFVTGHDFSFLRTALILGGFASIGFIVCGMLFGFQLGTVFTVAMIVLACGYILYDTSNVLHHYHIGQHVAASLALFASVALLFWYILQLVMSLQSRD